VFRRFIYGLLSLQHLTAAAAAAAAMQREQIMNCVGLHTYCGIEGAIVALVDIYGTIILSLQLRTHFASVVVVVALALSLFHALAQNSSVIKRSKQQKQSECETSVRM
jgi:hypothetical protein